MKLIKLFNGVFGQLYAEVDDWNYERISKYKWSATKGKDKKVFYARTNVKINGEFKTIRMHQMILSNNDKSKHIDHINGNGLCNLEENLRIGDLSQSMANRTSFNSSSSKYKGVSWNKKCKRWVSQIRKNNKNKTIGYFKTEIEAAIAYDKMALEIHGEFANLNFKEKANTE